MRKFQGGDIVDIYLKDCRRSVAEARRVLAECGANARDAIIVSYLPYAFYLAKRYRERGVDFEDLIQVANAAVVSAVDDFTEGRGKLSNFVAARVKWSLVSEIRTRSTCITQPDVSRPIDAPAVSSIFGGRAKFGAYQIASRSAGEPVPDPSEEVAKLFVPIPEKYRKLLQERLTGVSDTEHAKQRGVSPQSIRSMEKTALRKVFEGVGEQYFGQSLRELGVTKTYQPGNERTAISAFGRTQSLAAWCREFNIPNPGMVTHRIRVLGMSPEDALTRPSRREGESRRNTKRRRTSQCLTSRTTSRTAPAPSHSQKPERQAMSDVYRIKPLEWKRGSDAGPVERWFANTAVGSFYVCHDTRDGKCWVEILDEEGDQEACKSLWSAKCKARDIYRERILSALDPA